MPAKIWTPRDPPWSRPARLLQLCYALHLYRISNKNESFVWCRRRRRGRRDRESPSSRWGRPFIYETLNTVKKRFASFPSPAGMSLPNSPWAEIWRHNWIIPSQGEFGKWHHGWRRETREPFFTMKHPSSIRSKPLLVIQSWRLWICKDLHYFGKRIRSTARSGSALKSKFKSCRGSEWILEAEESKRCRGGSLDQW